MCQPGVSGYGGGEWSVRIMNCWFMRRFSVRSSLSCIRTIAGGTSSAQTGWRIGWRSEWR